MLEFKEVFSNVSAGMDLLQGECKQAECTSSLVLCCFICFNQKVYPNLGCVSQTQVCIKGVCVFRSCDLSQIFLSSTLRICISCRSTCSNSCKTFLRVVTYILRFYLIPGVVHLGAKNIHHKRTLFTGVNLPLIKE